ncbi:DinB family protein [Shivajiella indica]|uniref:DinB family protein n=1 Tax=Shivajiella indica TaxID=872115 RepID=A0ABW5B969_9BACT
MKNIHPSTRRDFMRSAAVITSGTFGLTMLPQLSTASPLPAENRINVMGPRDGFSLHIGTLLSMMTWMRDVILMPVRGMSVEQLDFLLDENSNSIGAMLLHLAATERFYQIHTFEGKEWGDFSKEDLDRFEVAMNLGDEARKTIKGNSLDYYLEIMTEVRENTIKEFKKRDDNWLMKVDKEWPWGPTNNYCKWFHVCEHESNHNGQFKYIKTRLPGGKFSRG